MAGGTAGNGPRCLFPAMGMMTSDTGITQHATRAVADVRSGLPLN